MLQEEEVVLRTGLVVAIAAATLIVAGCGGGGSHVTRQGALLRNFEALLHESFPGRSVVSMRTRRSGDLDFVCGGFCAPLSTYSPYWFVFRHPGRSAFRL